MSNETFECSYEVDDGYVGPSRPQRFNISASDINESMDDEDLAQLFNDSMSEHFGQNIFYYSKNMDEFLQWATSVRNNLKANEETS